MYDTLNVHYSSAQAYSTMELLIKDSVRYIENTLSSFNALYKYFGDRTIRFVPNGPYSQLFFEAQNHASSWGLGT